MKSLIVPLMLFALLPGATPKRSDEVKRLRRAAEVFDEIMKTPERAIPDELLDRSECVAIVPGVTKAGFVFGGRYGKGIIMCRKQDRGWTAPLFITIGGGSFGLQIGAQKVDLVMLIMNRKGIEKLIGDKVTLGADASAAAGPVGRQASAETDVRMNAEILTYSRARGLFAGVTLNGAVVKPDQDSNRDFYGEKVDARQVLIEGAVPMPAEARPLERALSRRSPRKT